MPRKKTFRCSKCDRTFILESSFDEHYFRGKIRRSLNQNFPPLRPFTSACTRQTQKAFVQNSWACSEWRCARTPPISTASRIQLCWSHSRNSRTHWTCSVVRGSFPWRWSNVSWFLGSFEWSYSPRLQVYWCRSLRPSQKKWFTKKNSFNVPNKPLVIKSSVSRSSAKRLSIFSKSTLKTAW